MSGLNYKLIKAVIEYYGIKGRGMTKTKWIYRQTSKNNNDPLFYEALKKTLQEKSKLNPLVSDILINRGIRSLKENTTFINPKLSDLHDPYKLIDMDKSIIRILKARDKKEMIYLYGDYDADGTIGVAILYLYLKKIGCEVDYFIPNRLITGYGLHTSPLSDLIKKEMKVLITIDNGTSALEEVKFCNAHGVDVIITDHHECHGALPEAFAIINPKRKDSHYPYPELCGAGVAFKLIQALSLKLDLNDNLQEYIECVSIATVADLVPLTGENRTLTHLGLQHLNKDPQNLGLKQLIAVSELEDIKAWHFGFVLGPKINAAGRLGQADRIVELLITEDSKKASSLAEFLRDENTKRQELEKEILLKAMVQVEKEALFEKEFIIVHGQGWHTGVIGIVASRIQEVHYRPVIVIGIENGIGKASCRSIEGFNLFEALSSFDHLFTSFGGHAQAAGFTICEDKIEDLKKAFEHYAQEVKLKDFLQKKIYYDSELSFDNLSLGFYRELAMFEPCGIGNPGIQFLINNPKIKSYSKMGKEGNHLRIDFFGIQAVGFGMGSYERLLKKRESQSFSALSFIAKLSINNFRGNKSLQLQIRDMKINPLYDLQKAKIVVNYIKSADCLDQDVLNDHIDGLALENLTLPIDILRKTYRFLKVVNTEYSITIETFESIELNAYQTLMILEILKENKLIDFSLNKNHFKIRILPISEKKDIQNSKLMIRLKKLTE